MKQTENLAVDFDLETGKPAHDLVFNNDTSVPSSRISGSRFRFSAKRGRRFSKAVKNQQQKEITGTK